MRKSLLVHPDNFAQQLSSEIVAQAAALRQTGRIETGYLGHVPFVSSEPTCSWHDDTQIADYTALLILRNDADSVVRVDNKPCEAQPVGTLMVLDVRRRHKLSRPGWRRTVRDLWVAAYLNYRGTPRRFSSGFDDDARLCLGELSLERAAADLLNLFALEGTHA